MHDDARRPIPPPTAPAGWVRLAITECGEPLVPLSRLAPLRLVVEPRYWQDGLPGALPEAYARLSVARRLLRAAASLPDGWRLVVLDAWRPLAVQQALYDGWCRELRRRRPEATAAEIAAEAARYVAPPSSVPDQPSPHATGGAVDVALQDAAGAEVPMGTPFDAFEPAARTRHFEERLAAGARLTSRQRQWLRHRRLLYHALTRAGLTNYPEEWWHFEYGRAQYGPILRLKDWPVLDPAQLSC